MFETQAQAKSLARFKISNSGQVEEERCEDIPHAQGLHSIKTALEYDSQQKKTMPTTDIICLSFETLAMRKQLQ